jgi:hypothetical protein
MGQIATSPPLEGGCARAQPPPHFLPALGPAQINVANEIWTCRLTSSGATESVFNAATLSSFNARNLGRSIGTTSLPKTSSKQPRNPDFRKPECPQKSVGFLEMLSSIRTLDA